MIILGIETSCDETAAAVLTNNGERITILSNVISSSAALLEKYGGILPEQAAREQVKMIIPVIEEALRRAFDVGSEKWDSDHLNSRNLDIKNSKSKTSHLSPLISNIDAIAVTYGPGLIGSLLVGVETAKTLARIWGKPLIPVNHLLGHFYANWLDQNQESRIKNQALKPLILPKFPCIGLLVSGGHTDLVLFKNHNDYEHLGGTRDDAAGECFDKCARLLGFPYPGGPKIAELASLRSVNMNVASQGWSLQIKLPRPMINSKNLDFSFSGLKTAFANIVHTPDGGPKGLLRGDLAASLEQAIVDVLVTKTVRAVKKYQVKQVIVAGGVAANQKLTSDLKLKVKSEKLKVKLHIPPPNLCTDNGAMIAARAFFESPIDPLLLQADPSLQYT